MSSEETQRRRIDELEKRAMDTETQLAQLRADLDARNAVAPPRPPSPSLVDMVEQIVAPRFDSLMPMQEKQLALLEGSAIERQARADREKKWAEFKRLGFAVLVCITAMCELARALLTH